MVTSESARTDCDNLFFSGDKTAIYYRVTETENLLYGNTSLAYTAYTIPIQGNVLSSFDRLVIQGHLNDGDAVGVLRYEYTEDADGTTITPTLIPKNEDEFVFLRRRYRIHKLTPQMSEDHNTILFTFEAKNISTNEEQYFPYTFPIQF